MAHRIRLRQPWVRRVHDADMSGTGKLSGNPSKVTFLRRFNRPTGLELNDQVEMELTANSGAITGVRLNTNHLEQGTLAALPCQSIRINLTDLLEEHNLIEVQLGSDEVEPELGDVNLWITASGTS